MPRKNRKLVKPAGHQLKEREQETVRAVNEALAAKDLQHLRKLSCVRGLVHHGLRERAWGTLCGASTPSAASTSHFSQAEYERWAAVQHRDRHVVRVDVERSLQTFLHDSPPEELAARRQQLERLINAAIGYHCRFDSDSDMAPITPENVKQRSREHRRHAADSTIRGPVSDDQGARCLRGMKSFNGERSGRSMRATSGASSFRTEASDSSRGSFRDREGSEQLHDSRRRRTGKLSCLGAPSTLSPSHSQDDISEPIRGPQASKGRLRGWGCLGGSSGAVRSPSYDGSSWAEDASLSLHTPAGSGSVADLGPSRLPSVVASTATTVPPEGRVDLTNPSLEQVWEGSQIAPVDERNQLCETVPDGSLTHNPLYGLQSAGGADISSGGSKRSSLVISMPEPVVLQPQAQTESLSKESSIEKHAGSQGGRVEGLESRPHQPTAHETGVPSPTATAARPVAHSHFDLARYSVETAKVAADSRSPSAMPRSTALSPVGLVQGSSGTSNGAQNVLSSADASLALSNTSSVQAGSSGGASSDMASTPDEHSTGGSVGNSIGGASIDMPATPDNLSALHNAGTPTSGHQQLPPQQQQQQTGLSVRTGVVRSDSDGLLQADVRGRGLHASDSGRTSFSIGEVDHTTSCEHGSRQADGAAAAAVQAGAVDLQGSVVSQSQQDTDAGLKPMSQDVYYYQGLHDIASVLLLVCGSEATAFPLLTHLVTCQLRDATRTTLNPVLEVMNLLYPLLRAVDPELEAHLRANDLPPFFALSWLITWFAHDVRDIQVAARLFDLFMAHHPLMPLYVGVAAMLGVRDQLLACTEMPELHTLLVNINVAQYCSHHDSHFGASMPGTPTRSSSISRQSSHSYRSGNSLSSPSYSYGSPSHTPYYRGSTGGALHYAGDSINLLIQDAIALFKKAEPASLVKRHKLLLTCSVLSAAERVKDRWVIPAVAPDAHKAGKVRRSSWAADAGGNIWQRLARTWKQFSNRGRVSPQQRVTAPAAPVEPAQQPPKPQQDEEAEVSAEANAVSLSDATSHVNLGLILRTGLSVVSVGVVYGLVLWNMRQGGEGTAGAAPVIVGVP